MFVIYCLYSNSLCCAVSESVLCSILLILYAVRYHLVCPVRYLRIMGIYHHVSFKHFTAQHLVLTTCNANVTRVMLNPRTLSFPKVTKKSLERPTLFCFIHLSSAIFPSVAFILKWLSQHLPKQWTSTGGEMWLKDLVNENVWMWNTVVKCECQHINLNIHPCHCR